MLLRLFVLCTIAFTWSFSGAQGVKHLMRQLTYCHMMPVDAGYELVYDGQELWHVDPDGYKASQRLPEFAGDWQLQDDLPSQAHLAIGTCFYNIPRCIVGENNPPESIVPPTCELYPKREVEIGVENTLICFVTDFHPPPVYISWTRNGKPVSELDSTETQYYSNLDFSFRIFSYLDFIPEEGDLYSCTVRHRGLENDVTRFWEVESQDVPQEVETAVLVVGIILGFLGFVAGIILIIMTKMQLPVI